MLRRFFSLLDTDERAMAAVIGLYTLYNSGK